ncbi:MAG: Na(+)-translocating NADH-quinone reductase subunit A [Bacteroidetes bacterium]|jgi:Na+-transporting NADH:ubiquinone oxidoreductase subunit A|nr:Na(+)-translocating NADH-quinone reductase subunit A [Bacteroidota bacterium]
MSKDIRIKKGLEIKLKGKAEKVVSVASRSKVFAIVPSQIHGVIPKLVVKVGDKVKAGDPIFFSKKMEEVKFSSPVSGEIIEINRGAKRKILNIKIAADATDSYKDFGIKNPTELSSEDVKAHLLASGCWPFIKQRPYDVVANPADQPKAIFISSFSSAPLAADDSFALANEQKEFQTGIDALKKLTTGKVHLAVDGTTNTFFNQVTGVEIHNVYGKHPAGNVGVQIHFIDPINQGDRVWVINPQDVAIIGRLFLHGKFDASRTIALAGSEVVKPQYVKTTLGADLSEIIVKNVPNKNVRVISGNVLTGININQEKFLGFYDNLVTVIPEGNHYEFLGWHPFIGNHKLSINRAFFSWLTPNKEYALDTNLNGEERAFVVTGEMEKVMPMDIFPMQLLKATLANDIEKMENLGIYEVAPEDFALVEFVSTSKIEAQEIIRKGLDLMIEEVG